MSEFLPKIHFSGNLGRDAEVKESRNGKTFLSFSVAVTPETYKQGDERPPAWWLNCFVFDGDDIKELSGLRKGDRVTVIGSLKRSRYEGRDGQPKEAWNCNAKGVIATGIQGGQRRSDDRERERAQEQQRRQREAEIDRQREAEADDVPW